ncbi:MAG: hypothetical protein WC527_06115 [Candidatus Margulisiibacteriota bacterium]
MVENIAAKAATVETAALSNQGLVMMQKDLLAKAGSSTDSKDNVVSDTDSTLKLLDSGSEPQSRLQFLSSHISKMNSNGFDFGKVDKPANKLRQLASEFEDTQGSDATKDAVQISAKYARQPQSQRFQLSKLALLAESFEASPQQKVAVQRYVQSYFAYLMSDDPKVKNRMQKDEDALRKSGLKEENIFSLQKQIKTAARADISVRIKENMFRNELSDSKVEQALSNLSANDAVGSAFNNKKLGGWNFSGVFGDLQTTVDKSAEQNRRDLSEFLLQDLEEQMISKMIKGDEDVSDLSKHITTLMKMGVNVLSWLKEEWYDKKFDLGLLQTSVFPEETTGKVVDFNADSQGQGGQRDPYQGQSESELMIGQLRSLYVQRLINSGFTVNMHISFKIRKLKNGLFKMGAFSEEIDDKLSFEAETIAKKKIMDMIEESMIERAGLFKSKGRAYDAHTKKVKKLLLAAERLGMKVDEQDLLLIRESVNTRMLKVISDQLDATKSMIAKRGKNRKSQKNVDNLKALQERLTKELKDNTPIVLEEEKPEKKATIPQKENNNGYV